MPTSSMFHTLASVSLILEFPGNKKHQGQHRQEHLRLLSNYGDRVTFHRLTAYHLFLGSHFDERLPRVTRGTAEYATTTNNTSFFRVFVVSSTKRSGKQIHAKTIWPKKCV